METATGKTRGVSVGSFRINYAWGLSLLQPLATAAESIPLDLCSEGKRKMQRRRTMGRQRAKENSLTHYTQQMRIET